VGEVVSAPQRIQRRRTKGWRMPEGTVYVGRPSRWGNPWVLHAEEIVIDTNRREDWWVSMDAPQFAVDSYRWDLANGNLAVTVEDVRRELAGRDLACWCPLDQPCHADVLLELANPEPAA
jgi:hypothetical protein